MTWQLLESELAATLRDLPDEGFVIVEATRPAGREVRRRRLWGLLPGTRATQQPYVQLLRVQDRLRGECVGSERTGGTFPLTDAEHQQILALGWVVPDREPFICPNYEREWPADDAGPSAAEQGAAEQGAAEQAAAIAVRILRDVFGCPRPEDVIVRIGH